MRIVDLHIERIANEFCMQMGKIEFPFDILGAASLFLPVTIIPLPDLSFKQIEQWLRYRGVNVNTVDVDRALHGLIIFNKGNGLIFLNSSDSEEERRYTLAHEVSHYILDYKVYRDKAVSKLGTEIQEIFDGVRAPTLNEKIDSLIHNVNLQPYVHLLEKNGNGSFESIDIFTSEQNADSLAIELLAPNQKVIKDTLAGNENISFGTFIERSYYTLISKYKLPNSIAKQYSKRLSYHITGGPSFMQKLGF